MTSKIDMPKKHFKVIPSFSRRHSVKIYIALSIFHKKHNTSGVQLHTLMMAVLLA